MNKTLEGGEAMKKEQMQTTPAGRVSQQQNMRKYVWSTVDAAGKLNPYVILECSEDIAEEIDSRDRYENKWMFIAERLHEKYPEQFPEWWDGYGKRNVFWYNNVLEEYEEALERLTEEWEKRLSDYYREGEEEALEEEAKASAEEELNNLPVVRI
jgi:hypothetical protein